MDIFGVNKTKRETLIKSVMTASEEVFKIPEIMRIFLDVFFLKGAPKSGRRSERSTETYQDKSEAIRIRLLLVKRVMIYSPCER